MIPAILWRLIAAGLLLLVGILTWESALSWRRYEPVTGNLGGFLPRPRGVLPVEPGSPGDRGPLLDPASLRGARYVELLPRPPFAWAVGSVGRVRLVGLYLADGDREDRFVPWGGGDDPLAGILDATRPVSRWFPGLETRVHEFRDLDASRLRRPQVLSVGAGSLRLGPGN